MSNFDEELQILKEKLLAMASHAESAVARAVRSLIDRDDALARQVRQDDNILDRYEIEIDDIAIHLLSMAPVASTLRLITVAMKISQNLERVGDEAAKISRRALSLNAEPQLKPYVDLVRMEKLALKMLRGAIDAFVERHPGEARTIIPSDKEVDQLNRQMQQELSNLMLVSPDNISRCLALMSVSRSLERVADHATNIAEEIVYLYEAHDIRHPKIQPNEAENPGR